MNKNQLIEYILGEWTVVWKAKLFSVVKLVQNTGEIKG